MQANEQLQARLDGLRNQPSALTLAQAKQEEHIRDRDKFKTLIDNLQVGLAFVRPRCICSLICGLTSIADLYQRAHVVHMIL